MYTRDNYEKVKAIIDQRRNEARISRDERTIELRRRLPELAKIDEELRGTGLVIFKTACEGGDILSVRSRNEELVKKRRELIKSIGFPEDYDEIKYTCPHCNDTGYVDINMCNCFRSLLLIENVKSSGMGKLIDKQSFDNFDFNTCPDDDSKHQMELILKSAKAYATNFGKHIGHNLLLIGKTGTGKTHISTAIAKTVIEKGYYVLYDSAQNIVSAFETDTFKKPAESVSEKYLECDLLILDDLGTEFTTQFTVSCLYNLINTRYNRGLSTVISTNLSARELSERYDDRIYSRIVGANCTIFEFKGLDRRLNSTLE